MIRQQLSTSSTGPTTTRKLITPNVAGDCSAASRRKATPTGFVRVSEAFQAVRRHYPAMLPKVAAATEFLNQAVRLGFWYCREFGE
jgi:hypothetical protein